MDLFNLGEHYPLHSGHFSQFKIDCDFISDEALYALVGLIINIVPPFTQVIGIPTGGKRLAYFLKKYESNKGTNLLIVDDVLTTGNSMEKAKIESGHPYVTGVVLFSRGECPDWIIPIFTLNSRLYFL